MAVSSKYMFAQTAHEPPNLVNENLSYVMLDKVVDAFPNYRLRSSMSQDIDRPKNQRAFFKSDFSCITIEKLENYFMLLVAFDKNLREHQALRKNLVNIRKIIRALNDRADARLSQLAEKRPMRESHSLHSFEEVNSDYY